MTAPMDGASLTQRGPGRLDPRHQKDSCRAVGTLPDEDGRRRLAWEPRAHGVDVRGGAAGREDREPGAELARERPMEGPSEATCR